MDALHKTVLDGIAIEVSLAKPQNDQKKKKFQMIKVNINYVISYCIIDRDITLQRGSSEFFPSPMRGGRYDYYQHVPMAPRGRGETINKTVLRLHSSTCRLFSPSNGLPTLSNARSVRSILQVAILEPSHIVVNLFVYSGHGSGYEYEYGGYEDYSGYTPDPSYYGASLYPPRVFSITTIC